MSYAIRNDGMGWRSVAGPQDCAADETWQEAQPAVLTPAQPSAPTTITMRQAQLALLAAGLLDSVDAAIADAPRAVQVTWATAGTVDRDNPLIAALQPTLGLTDAQLDALFELAATL
jgi:hypothetical protein